MNSPASFPLNPAQYVQDTPAVQTPGGQINPPQQSFVFKDYNKVFIKLISDFDALSGEKAKAEKRREFRRHHVNIKDAREKEQILADETIIPDRTIEANIRREKSPLCKYLTQPTTVLSFTDANQPDTNFTPLATYYTDLNRKTGWQIEWFYLIDAIETHGAAYMEVFFDPSSPIMSKVEYVRRDHLIFPPGTRSLNACGTILRRFEITKEQFAEFARTYGFDQAQVDKINTYYANKEEFIRLHRAYLKKDGVINVAWISDDKTVNDNWLATPTPYDIGIRVPGPIPGQFIPAPVTQVPIIAFPLDLEEDEDILKVQGRVSLDLHIQEAMTAIISAIVNGAVRAAGLYPTRKTPDGLDAPRNQELVTLKHGNIIEGDFTFGKLDWPSSVGLSIAQFLKTQNASQSGGIDWAAMNRPDTAKTATELNLAQQESNELRSTSTTLFALCSLMVELLRWQIYLSQIQAGLLPRPQFNPPINLESPSLVPTMSADQQVVRRAEQTTRFMQYWPFVQNSPYMLPMLETMLQDAFPREFIQWQQKASLTNQLTQQAQQQLDLLNHAFAVLRQIPPASIPQGEQKPYVQFLNNLGGYLQQTNPPPAKPNATNQPPQLTSN